MHNHWNHPSKVQQNTFLNVNTLRFFQILSGIENLSNIREQAGKPQSNANPPSDSECRGTSVASRNIPSFTSPLHDATTNKERKVFKKS